MAAAASPALKRLPFIGKSIANARVGQLVAQRTVNPWPSGMEVRILPRARSWSLTYVQITLLADLPPGLSHGEMGRAFAWAKGGASIMSDTAIWVLLVEVGIIALWALVGLFRGR